MGKCQICGNNSGMYPLCFEHMQMKNEGKVIKCTQCGVWHLTTAPCNCINNKKQFEFPIEGFEKCIICGTPTKGFAFCLKCFKEHTDEEKIKLLNNHSNKKDNNHFRNKANSADHHNNVVIVNTENKSVCITCGRKTDGLLFCSSCYHKYEKKDLLFRITNCSQVELLDDSYEGRYTCKDGHIVKSKSERDIDNFLYEHDIRHAYEREWRYGENEKDVLTPDFYLPDYLGKGKHVYIEHWGYNENNIKYTKTKKFKMPIYKQKGVTLICTYEKTDADKIDSNLEWKLNKSNIKEGQINYE